MDRSEVEKIMNQPWIFMGQIPNGQGTAWILGTLPEGITGLTDEPNELTLTGMIRAVEIYSPNGSMNIAFTRYPMLKVKDLFKVYLNSLIGRAIVREESHPEIWRAYHGALEGAKAADAGLVKP